MAPDFKKGKPPVGGIDREIKLQVLFALKGFQHFENGWKLSNENERAGKFDDLVFETDSGDILLQSKYKESGVLNDDQFLSTNPNKDSFSLAKYIISYKTIETFNTKYLILCTTVEINSTFFTKASKEEYQTISNIFDDCNIYAIKHATPSLISELQQKVYDYKLKKDYNIEVEKADIEEFLHKFVCIAVKDGKMESSIRKVLEYIGKASKFPVSSYKYVVDQIQIWYNLKPGKAKYMTYSYIQSILYGETNIQEIEKFLDESITFRPHYQFHNFNLIKLDSTTVDLKLNKVLQSLWTPYKNQGKLKENFYNDTLFLNIKGEYENEQKILDCFLVDKFKNLIIFCQKATNQTKYEKLYTEVKNINKNCHKDHIKKVIMIQPEDCSCINKMFKIIDETISFKNLSSETQTKISQTTINFQGTLMSLSTLHINNSYLENVLNEDTILKLLKHSSKYAIGSTIKQLGSIEDYYIKRTLNIARESFSEEEILSRCSQKVLVITDQPGSGKSTLLIKLTNLWKTQYPQHWVLQLDLGITINYIKENDNRSSLLELLHLHSNNADHLEKHLLFLLNKCIILDGIDEINVSDRSILLSFIKRISLSDDVIKIVMTTRSYSFILEELTSIDDLEILTLQEFSATEQIIFLKKYFDHSLHIEMNNVEGFVESLPAVLKHFLSIPLYIEMIANIFSNQNFSQLFTLENGNTYKLFEAFLERKKEIFIRSKGNCDNNSVLYNILSDCFERYLEELESLATKNNFGKMFLDVLKVETNKVVKNTVLHVGILEQTNNDIYFAHKTFEEYFTAKFVWKRLIANKYNEEIMFQVYKEVFLNIDKQNVCHFIDCIIEGTDLKQYDSISRKFGTLLELLTWDENKKLLKLASQGSVNILKLVFNNYENVSEFVNKKEKHGETALLLSAHHLPTIKYLIEKGADLKSKDDNGFAVLHYATTRMSNFENFEIQIAALNKSLHYKEMMFHMNSVHTTLYRHKELDSYMKKFNSDSEKHLILQRHPDKFPEIVKYFLNRGINLNKQTKIGTTVLHYVAYCGLHQEFNFLIEIGARVNIKDIYGNNIMHYAVLGGSIEIVRFLHSININLNEANLNGVSPIHFAPIGNSTDVASFLIDHGVNIETEDFFGRTALFYVNSATSLDIVRLFESFGIQMERKSTELKYNILHMAAYTNAVNIVEHLMKLDLDLYSSDKLGQYPEHYAAEGDSVKVLKYFQNTTKSITAIIDLKGATALHLAAVGNAVNSVRYLINELQMDPEIKDFSEKMPIHYAAGSGSSDVVKYFYRYGMHANISDRKGATLLHYAAANGSLEAFKHIRNITSIDLSVVDDNGRHIVHYAAENDSLEVLMYLLAASVPEYLIDFNGDTILHRAVVGNSINITCYVLEKYPNLYKPNFTNKLPLHYAVEVDAIDIVKYLIESGKDKDVLLRNNVTILHLACSRNAINVVDYLIIQCEMDVNQTNKDGKMCIHYAAETNSIQILKYLLTIGSCFEATDSYGGTVVHYAAHGNAVDTLQYLVDELGLSILIPDHGGKLPIHYASRTDALDAIKYFISKRINIYIPDYRNNTVLHWCAVGNAERSFRYYVQRCNFENLNRAEIMGKQTVHVAIEFDSVEVVRFILNNNLYDDEETDGNTLLHFAARYDAIKVLQYFVEEINLPMDRKNTKRQTPLDIAVQNQSLKVMEYFHIPVKRKKFCKVM